MKIYLLFSFVLLANILYSQSQEENNAIWQKFIHVETNGILPNSKMKENIPIRQNISTNSYYQKDGKIITGTKGVVYGSRFELYNHQLKLGISAGIKYWNTYTTIKGKVSDNAEYFYFRYVSDNQESRFARVKSISEKHHFLTVPIDLRYYIFNRKRYGFFIRTGADLGYNINYKLNIVFVNPEMNQNKGEVLDVIPQSFDEFYTSAFASLGFRYYYLNKICTNFEFNLYSTYFGKTYFILSDASRYAAVKLSIQIPINLIIK